MTKITVDPNQRFQEVDGFGVNFNGPYFRETQKPMVDMLIDDLGATIFRLDAFGFDLSNWEQVNDNDDPNVMNWEYYNDRYSIPNFEASWAAGRYLNSKGARILLTAIGIVPDWMLDDKAPPPRHKVCSNSSKPSKPDHLNPAMYEEFGEMLTSMAFYARHKAHVDFEYLSPFNETDCYPAEGPRIDPEEASRVLEVLARRMKKEGLGDVKLVAVDQAIVSTDYISPILENSELMKQIGAFSFHTYGEESVGPQVDRVSRSKYPHTRVWLTEYGDLNDRDKSFENEWKNQSLKSMQRALRALNQGATVALFWDAFDNLELCEMRPSFYGLMRNDDHHYSPKKRYFATKQLYHFVRPGARRIASSSDVPGVISSAFLNGSPESIIVVGVKQGGPSQVQITVPAAKQAPVIWELYQTTRTLDCRQMGSFSAINGVVQLELPDEAIFTLVGKARNP
ncbi:MAG TPA: glycosyl hydrolase [Terriglobia bacterium]|nr:glycosyl hydrolase [Terriglobia bacterium]